MPKAKYKRVSLTISNVPTLPAVDGHTTVYLDTILPGLYLRVSPPSERYPQGVRAYGLRYRARGQRLRHRLGRLPAVSLGAVRARARAILEAASLDGTKAADDAPPMTLNAMLALWLSDPRKRGKARQRAVRGPSTVALYEAMLRTHVEESAAGGRAAAEVARPELRALLEDVAARAPVTANRLLQALKAAFRWARAQDPPLVPSNPTEGIDRPTVERAKERVLSDPEVAILWRVTERVLGASEAWSAAHPAALEKAVCLRLVLLLGQRPGETALMRWRDVDLDGRLWVSPAANRKGQRGQAHDHAVPLSDLAAEQLRAQVARTGEDPRVFPGIDPTDRQWARWIVYHAKAAGTAHWSPHDLRRTCATGLARLGYGEDTIALVLGHELQGGGAETWRYSRWARMPERAAALAAWGAHVAALVG